MWTHHDSIDVQAPARAVWALFKDVARWKDWNAGIERIELHGAFQSGTRFTMTNPGQAPLVCTLLEVRPDRGFVDETRVGPNRVVVRHLITPLAEDRCRIDYATEIGGPEADEIGATVTSDFPDVLYALKRLAEQTTR